ncbi:MAG: hypothetical protein ABIS21_03190 [Acidimicrobiales bacterium]
MTEAEIAAIAARADAATPGPWVPYFTVHGDPYVTQPNRGQFGMVVSTARDDYGRADCQFLAAARTDVPALVAEVRRLRAFVQRLRLIAQAYERDVL